jgi:hypothetical protein
MRIDFGCQALSLMPVAEAMGYCSDTQMNKKKA